MAHGQEKPAIVLDLGTALFRCGYVGEATPRAVMRSPALDPLVGLEDVVEALSPALSDLLLVHLQPNTKNHRVLVCDNILLTYTWKRAVAVVLLQHLHVQSLAFVPSPFLCILATCRESGLVLDCGFKETRAVAVFNNTVIVPSLVYAPIGASTVHACAHPSIVDAVKGCGMAAACDGSEGPRDAKDSAPSWAYVEDVLVRGGFVAPCAPAPGVPGLVGVGDIGLAEAKDVVLPPWGPSSLRATLPSTHRFMPYEALFDEDDEYSVPVVVLQCLLKCPIDIRRAVVSNLVLTGGVCDAPGFGRRLVGDLHRLVTEDPRFYSLSAVVATLVVHAPTPGWMTAYLGGAVFGATPALVVNSFDRVELEGRGGHVPDSLVACPSPASEE